MAERVQVADLQQAPSIQPAARPVDTFVFPGQQFASNGLTELAQGLRDFQPTFNRYLEQEKETYDDAALAEGVALYEENKNDFAQAIKDGTIPAGASPHLRRGYREAELRNKARTFESELRLAYKESGLAGQDDPDAVAIWQGEFYDQWAEGNLAGHVDAEIISSFLPRRDQAFNALANDFTNDRIEAYEEGRMIEFENEVAGVLTDALVSNAPRAETAAVIKSLYDDLYSEDPTVGKEAGQVIVDLLENEARRLGRTDIMSLLNNIETTPGSTLGGTQYASDRVQSTNEYIEDKAIQLENLAWSRYQRRVALETTAASQGYLQALRSDPALDAQDFIERHSITQPEVISQLYALQGSFDRANAARPAGPEVMGPIYQDLNANPESTELLSDVTQQYAGGEISQGEFQGFLSDRATAIRMADQADPASEFNTSVSELRSSVDTILVQKGPLGQILSDAPNIQASNRLQFEIMDEIIQWTEQNPQENFPSQSAWERAGRTHLQDFVYGDGTPNSGRLEFYKRGIANGLYGSTNAFDGIDDTPNAFDGVDDAPTGNPRRFGTDDDTPNAFDGVDD